MTPEELAQLFHETYERLAPAYNYQTRKASAVPWSDVPANNKNLMIAVASEVLQATKKCEHDFDMRLGEYDLVRWCHHCGFTVVAYRQSHHNPVSNWWQVKDEEAAEALINQS